MHAPFKGFIHLSAPADYCPRRLQVQLLPHLWVSQEKPDLWIFTVRKIWIFTVISFLNTSHCFWSPEVSDSQAAPTYHGDAQQGWADQKHRGQELDPTSFPERVEEVCPADNPQQKPQGLEEKYIHVLQWTALELHPDQSSASGDQPTPTLSAMAPEHSTYPLGHTSAE